MGVLVPRWSRQSWGKKAHTGSELAGPRSCRIADPHDYICVNVSARVSQQTRVCRVF